MKVDLSNTGCNGGSCPKQERCARYINRENRGTHFHTPPFNRYEGGKFACNYYEQNKEED